MNRNYNFFRVDMRKMKTEALMIFTAHSLTKKKKKKKKIKKIFFSGSLLKLEEEALYGCRNNQISVCE
jgi:hypothetical protein